MTIGKFIYFLGIGIGLAMDAFALTIANCTTYKKTLTKLKAWSMPVAFSLFQFIMPVIGFYIGSVFAEFIKNFADFLTAAVFFILAVKIVFDNVKEKKEEKSTTQKESKHDKKFSVWLLLLQGVLTSIDALLIGFTFAVDGLASPFLPCAIIGVVTFIIVAVALLLGTALGKIMKDYAKWIGAVILFALSVKCLITALI